MNKFWAVIIAITIIVGVFFVYNRITQNVQPMISLKIEGPIRQVAISQSGTWLSCVTSNGSTVIYNINTAKFINGNGLLNKNMLSAAFSSDSNLIAFGDDEGGVHLWDTNSEALQRSFENTNGEGEKLAVQALAFSPNSKLLAAGGEGGYLTVIDVVDNKVVHQLRGSFDDKYLNQFPPVNTIAFSNSGNLLAVGFGFYSAIHVWEVTEGKLISTFAESRDVKSIKFTANDDTVVFVYGTTQIEEWFIGTRKPKWKGYISTNNLPAASISTTGDYVAFSGSINSGLFAGLPLIGENNNNVYIANLSERIISSTNNQSGISLHSISASKTFGGNNDSVFALDFDSSNTLLVSGSSNGRINIYQPKN
jgi:WD40 repeat protein